MFELINNLNERQKEAVLNVEGPVMVMAGAGSGKTRVLTLRIAHLINDCGIYPSNILAVTFTNKAAREMKERISKYIKTNVDNMWVSTFHSICARLLRIEISKLEIYPSNFTIIDEDDAVKIIKEEMKELDISIKEYKPSAIKCKISAFKNNMSLLDNPIHKRIYNAYQERLKKDGLLDFDDLILVTLELFNKRPDVLKKYQDKFNYILVDEFQDTNDYQYLLVMLLAMNHKNIFVVGDQDQSIYSFRGAKIENINKFTKDFLNTKIILLEQNYRSTNSILKIANNVIDNNKQRFKKNLFTVKENTELPVFYNADSAYEELSYIVDKIKELKASGYNYNDFAIIYRSNYLSRGFEDILIKYQIPYVIYGGISFFQRKEIKDMIAYLRLISNYNDDFSFKRIVNEPKRKIGDSLINKLMNISYENDISLFNSIDLINASGIGYNNLKEFKDIIIELNKSLETIESLPKILDLILIKTGYYDMLKKDGDEGKDRYDNIKELKSVLKEAEEYYEGSKIEKIISLTNDLSLRTNTDNKSETENSVKLMTFHQSKGLEYKVVFLPVFEEGVFPSQNCFSYEELEEERRVCYVGITRAMEKLYITCANSRYMYGSQTYSIKSSYINEMGLENLNVIKKPKRENEYKLFKPEPYVSRNVSNIKEIEKTDNKFNLGDKLNHKLFGDGVVVSINGDIISVAFSEQYGIKKLMSNHPSIRKL